MIKEIRTLEDGIQVITNDGNTVDICTTELGDTWYKVGFYNGTAWYSTVFVSMDKTTDHGAILDKVADFIEANEFEGLYSDFYECQDNDLVDENGEVIDMVPVGNHGIYISNQFQIEEVK